MTIKIRRYSASQLSKFRACGRAWWFERVAGYRTPPGPSQLLGSAIHKGAEDYLTDGAEPGDARVVAALESVAAHTPPGGRLHVEGGIEIPLAPALDGTPRAFVGFIDLLDDGDPVRPVITDHKTTSDLKYAKTSYELAEDVQMLAYAKHAIDKYPSAVEVELRHNVIPTRGIPRAVMTSTKVSRAHVERKWSSFLPIFAEMDRTHAISNAADVPATGHETGECSKYGGCPHAGRCASAIFRTETIAPTTTTSGEQKGTTNMGIEDLKAKLAKMRGETVPTQATTTKSEEKTPEPAAAEKPAAKVETAPKTREILDGAKASAPADAPSATDTKAKLAALRAKVAKPAADAPKKPEAAATPANVEAPGLAELAAREAAAAPHVTTTEAPGEVVKTEVRKGETPSGAYTQEMTEEFTAAQFAPRKGPRVRFLLLNALPAVGLTATPLETFLEPILSQIQKETGKNWQMHQYREGTGMIVDGIGRAAEHGLLPETLAVDTTTALGKVAIEALMHRADVVISGRAA